MKELIKSINNEILDSLGMSNYILIDNTEYQGYFKANSSLEHYRILTHISNQHNNEIFLDIGTLKGSSALALASNNSNTVYSFNLNNQLELKETPNNIEFIIDDVINGKYDELILKSKLILLDTFHDGLFEREFYNHILNIGYSGTLLLDDIHLNDEMIKFWDEITLDKLDITNIGHSTGTGAVFFY